MEPPIELDSYTIVQDHRQKTSSCVWKYFGNLKMNGEIVDEKHVYCTKCFDESRTKKYQKSTSTGNLIKHLKKAHNVSDQQSYRIKQGKDRMVVTKEELTFNVEDDVEDYYIDANFIPLNTSTVSRVGSSESDNNEYLVHDINEILIHEISKRPQIYDANLCTKNKAQVRRDLWTEIYEALNHLIAYDKLPKIWKNIRDRYQKIKKDVDRDGRMPTGKPRYRYYDMLRFLDDVECVATAGDDDKLTVPIDNFVSNFIFMEDEPEVEQPDNAEQMIHQQLLLNDDDEEDELAEEDLDDDDDDEDDVTDITQLQTVSIQEALNAVVKEEIFGHDPPMAKKIKLDHSDTILLDEDPSETHPNDQQQQQQQQLEQELQLQHRDLMTPDNIASLLVEQHQHDMLCHQQSAMSRASTIASSPPSSPQLPVTTWQITPHLSASIGTSNSALQQHHNPVSVALMPNAESTVTMLHMDDQQQQQLPTAQSIRTPLLHQIHREQDQPQTLHHSMGADRKQPPSPTSTSSPTVSAKPTGGGASEEFAIFGSYVAEVMRNMDKQKARMLQMKVMQLITEYDVGSGTSQ